LIKELVEIKERRNKVIDELCEDQNNDYTISLKQNQMKQYFKKIKYFVHLIECNFFS